MKFLKLFENYEFSELKTVLLKKSICNGESFIIVTEQTSFFILEIVKTLENFGYDYSIVFQNGNNLENVGDVDYIVFENFENIKQSDLNILQNLINSIPVIILTNNEYDLQKLGNLLNSFKIIK